MKHPTVNLLIQWIDRLAPFANAEEWDNCGLLVGDPQASVSRVLVALDPTAQTVAEAVAKGCQALVTHHPLLIQPVKTVRFDHPAGALIARAIREGVHLIAAHTNLDVAVDGTNHTLASLLRLTVEGPLQRAANIGEEDGRYAGLGLVGTLPKPLSLRQLALELAGLLQSPWVRFVGDAEREISRVGLCTGSGAGFVEQAAKAGCQALVTGDVKYHDAHGALDLGLALVDVGHFASERIIVEPLARYLSQCALREGVALEVTTSSLEEDPFQTLVVR